MQQENNQQFGIPIVDIPADREVYRIQSYNPRYREIIIKEGTNPIAPPNSEVISRVVQPQSNSLQVTYGIFAELTYMPLAADQMEAEALKKATAANNPIAEAKQVLSAKDGLNQDSVATIMSKDLVYATPKTPLDAERLESKQSSTIISEYPSLAAKSVEGFSSMGEDGNSDMIVPGIIIVFIIVAFIAAAALYIEHRKSSSGERSPNTQPPI